MPYNVYKTYLFIILIKIVGFSAIQLHVYDIQRAKSHDHVIVKAQKKCSMAIPRHFQNM